MNVQLTPAQRKAIAETEATMAVEGMPLTPDAKQMLIDYETGAKTETQILAEIREEALRGEVAHG